MKRNFLALLFMLCPAVVFAEMVPIASDLSLSIDVPQTKWTISSEAPAFLVNHIAEHMDKDMLEKARQAGIKSASEAARKMLSANELFVFNQDSGAHLEIDVSPLKADEKPPSNRAIVYSARFAGESLASEEGMSGVTFDTSRFRVPGAKTAHRIDASYMREGQKNRFIGIVGFAAPYWFYFYYTDPLASPQDKEDFENILKSIEFQKSGTR